MIDFPYTDPNTFTCTALLLMYFIPLIRNYKRVLVIPGDSQDVTTNTKTITLFLIGIFISCFCVDGDFFRLMPVIQDYNFTIGAYNYGEAVYGIIAFYTNCNYLLFRLIVWGGAFLIFCITAKRFNVDVYRSSIYLFACFPVIFCYARVTLCMAIYFLGLSYFCKPLKKKYIGYALGILLFYASTFFHNTSYVMLLLTLAIWAPINKKTLFLFLVLMPIIIRIAQSAFLDLASMSDSFENEGFADRINRNADAENVSNGLTLSNPGVFLHTVLQYVSFYVPLYYVAKTILKNDYTRVYDMGYIKLFKSMMSFLLLSTVFLFFQQGSFVMYYRVLYMSMIPLCLLVVYLFNNNYMKASDYRKCLWSGILFTSVRIIYCFYGYGL